MLIESFEWDEHNAAHIARHAVEPDEAEEVFASRYILFKSYSGRYIALGHSAVGRYLACIFERKGAPGVIRIVTAREMNHSERRLFKQKRSL